MTSIDVQAYALLAMVLKASAPYDLGNLSAKGIIFVQEGNNAHIQIGAPEITIQGGKTIDYAPYTNEPWLSHRWNGKSNPNQGWIQKAIKRAIPLLQQVYDGMSIEEYNELMDELQLEYITTVRKEQPKGKGVH